LTAADELRQTNDAVLVFKNGTDIQIRNASGRV